MHTFLSALPVLAVIVSLLAGIPALRAAWLGLAATLLAVTISFPVPPEAIWPAILRWTPIVLEVLLIIGGGLWMSQVLQHSGAQAELARWIRDRAGPGGGAGAGAGRRYLCCQHCRQSSRMSWARWARRPWMLLSGCGVGPCARIPGPRTRGTVGQARLIRRCIAQIAQTAQTA